MRWSVVSARAIRTVIVPRVLTRIPLFAQQLLHILRVPSYTPRPSLRPRLLLRPADRITHSYPPPSFSSVPIPNWGSEEGRGERAVWMVRLPLLFQLESFRFPSLLLSPLPTEEEREEDDRIAHSIGF